MSDTLVTSNGTQTPVRLRDRGPIKILLDPLFWRGALYLALSMGLGILWFVSLVVAIPVSIGLVIVWVGVPLLALTMIAWRGAAKLERRLMKAAFGVEIPDPYKPMPQGSLLAKWKAMAGDYATWKDFAYLMLQFPVGIAEFVVSAVFWATTGFLLALPFITLIPSVDPIQINFGGWVNLIDDPIEALPWTLIGIVLLPITVYVIRGMALAHAAYAKVMLGRSHKAELAARAAHLQSSRARGVDAADADRRRIERDLHDGAQQRLLSVALDIGRAREKFEEDPEAARALLEQAHSETKETIAELRNLARGIYPAILTNRGLDAALSALAARAPVPVDVSVDLDERPPAAVESIAYFIVAECLTNVAKHSDATEAAVRVARDSDRVVVEVTDNGTGGAEAHRGGGLAGLGDRAATIDGTISVDSPSGGPTNIRAELPCEW
jgi:signal transduction histidine kinase